MLVQPQPRKAPTQQARQCSFARFERFAPQILAVEFQQVEGEQEHAAIVALVAQPLEHGEAVLVAGDRLDVDQAGARLEPVHGLDDGGIAVRPVVPVAGEQPHAAAVSAHHEAVAVVLDLVNPVCTGWGLVGGRWQAGFDETGRSQVPRFFWIAVDLRHRWQKPLDL